jgi:hypothetical protein
MVNAVKKSLKLAVSNSLPDDIASEYRNVVYKCITRVYDISNIKNKVNIKDLKIIVTSDEDVVLYSLPPNIIVVSTKLIDKRSGCSADEISLTALLAHELCHIWYGHTEEKWKWTVLGSYSDAAEIVNLMNSLLLENVNYAPKIQVSMPEGLPNYKYSDWFFETAADLYALKALENLNLDVNVYCQYLEKICLAIQQGNCSVQDGAEEASRRLDRVKSYINYTRLYSLTIDQVNLVAIQTGAKPIITELKGYRELKESTKNNPFADNVDISLLKNISLWKEAIKQNKKWLREFGMPNYEEIPITAPTWDSSEIKVIGTSSFTNIPVSINGYKSFIEEKTNLTYNFRWGN